MRKLLTITILILLIIGALLYYFLQPGGDTKKYLQYFPITERERIKDEVTVTFFGNTCLLFDDGDTQILFDPFLSRPGKIQTLFSTIDTDSTLVNRILKKYFTHLNAIFVSHSHVDHILDAPLIAQSTKATVYGSLSTQNYALINNVPLEQIVPYDEELGHTIGDFHVIPISSIHSKPTIFNNDLGHVFTSNHPLPYKLKEFKEGGSYDFIIKHGKKVYLIKASYNPLSKHYQEMKVDVAFLGITGLGKADDTETKKYFEHLIHPIHPSIIIPIHWDDFLSPLNYPLTPIFKAGDNVDAAFDKLIQRQNVYNYQFLLMDVYQNRTF